MIFKKISEFFTRLKILWKLSHYPDIQSRLKQFYAVLEKESVEEQEWDEFRTSLAESLPLAVQKLVPRGRHEMRDDDPRQPLHVKIKSGEIISSREADQILRESMRDFKLPQSGSKKLRQRLEEHNDKYNG